MIKFENGYYRWVVMASSLNGFLLVCQDKTNDVWRFGSWTYNGNKVDFIISENHDLLSEYSDDCPSVIQSHQTRRNVMMYDCCPETYVDITVKFQLASR